MFSPFRSPALRARRPAPPPRRPAPFAGLDGRKLEEALAPLVLPALVLPAAPPARRDPPAFPARFHGGGGGFI